MGLKRRGAVEEPEHDEIDRITAYPVTEATNHVNVQLLQNVVADIFSAAQQNPVMSWLFLTLLAVIAITLARVHASFNKIGSPRRSPEQRQ
jgi:hypothetical protein